MVVENATPQNPPSNQIFIFFFFEKNESLIPINFSHIKHIMFSYSKRK